MKLSIDPSINSTGFAISQNNKIIASGVIKTKGKNDSEKLKSLFCQIENLYKKFKFDMVILEITDFFIYQTRKNPFSGKPLNIKSLCKLNKAIAIIELFCSMNNIKLIELTPAQWKNNLSKSIIIALTKKKNHNEAEAILLNQVAG